jgi:hypothetical protein
LEVVTMPVSERGRLALLVVVVIVAGCGDGADPGPVPGEEVPGPLVSCTRGERDVFPESRLSGDLLSREELVDVAMGAGLAESVPVGGFGPEEGFYSTADGFLILDDSMIGSVIDGRVVGYFYLEQQDSDWVLRSWGECTRSGDIINQWHTREFQSGYGPCIDGSFGGRRSFLRCTGWSQWPSGR